MEHALAQARAAAAQGEIPVGAVVTDASGAIIASAHNRTEATQNPTAHAEFLALQAAAAARGEKYLADCTITVTLEPCVLCAGAIAAFRLRKLVFGAYDPKTGAVEHGPRVFTHATTHHKPEIIGGVRDSDCAALLASFFAGLRNA
ncbi:nucleoside deaminase [Acidocella sp.]|uniref:nucleoside deaminase n=1 Tax=Acidocella sp. TaxID=50710 RepID=UPI00184DC8CC|nr:nucleoside deaminase [Acidocella sp.]